MPNLTLFVEEILAGKVEAAAFAASRRLAELYPDQIVMHVYAWQFALPNYLRYAGVEWRYLPEVHIHYGTTFVEKEPRCEASNALVEVQWRDHRLRCLLLGHEDELVFVVSPSESVALEFIKEVQRFSQAVAGEVLVFAEGCLCRDREIDRQIASASMDDVILNPDTEKAVREQVLGFFDAREAYAKFGIPWKRGILLTGPPGNGKTQTIKAMASMLRRPIIYVRSFDSPRRYGGSSEADGIRKLFAYARRAAPCMVVFEDLDSLVSGAALSVFLNEMDGFRGNEGILSIATSNHPEKLDPAIKSRPSRFDRTIVFDPPGTDERRRYLARITQAWDEAMRPTLEGLDKTVGKTEGLSFAYLKELCVSSMMAWMASPETGMDEILSQQVRGLRVQANKKKA